MKRKLKFFITFPILVLYLWGCEEQFMDLNPLASISAPTYWKSKKDFDLALTACYASLQNATFSTQLAIWDCLADNGYTQHDFQGAQSFIRGEITPNTGGLVSGLYSACYSVLARQHIFMNQLAKYTGTDISEALKNQYMGEVRFIRALMYFYLYQCYGDVPLVTEVLTIENMIQPKVDASQIYTQIISDLDFAINNCLPAAYFNTGSGGHITESAAKALKARVLMTEAYGNTGAPNLTILDQAQVLSLSVMNDYGYQLSPVFGNLFRQFTQQGNREIIFSVKFLGPDNSSSWDMWYGDWLDGTPYRDLVNEFENADGTDFIPSVTLDSKLRPINVWTNRDPRFNVTVYGDTILWPGGKTHTPSNAHVTGYGLRKFLTSETLPYTSASRSGQDAVLIRLAEVMLNYAEAENEINGPTTACYNAINAIRARPSVNLPELPAGLDKAQMRDAIRHERRVELAFEGFRYFDIKRWHIASAELNNVDGAILPFVWNEKFYKWPLPLSQIEISAGVLVQNPDYD